MFIAASFSTRNPGLLSGPLPNASWNWQNVDKSLLLSRYRPNPPAHLCLKVLMHFDKRLRCQIIIVIEIKNANRQKCHANI